jgi:NitT/TauT family transport system substrate-binding protein
MSKKMMMSALLLAVSSILVVPSVRAEMEATTVAIPVLSLTFSPNYVAADKGFWRELDLEVKFVSIPGVGATNAVLSGSVDFANTASSAFLRAVARGQKLVAIGNTLERVQIEVVASKAFLETHKFNAQAPADARAKVLKGAKIAVDAPNSIVHGYIRYAAKKAGLDPERDITIAPMAPSAMLAAMRTGQVDGLAMSRPWPSMMRAEGIGLTVLSSPQGDFPELDPFNYNLIITRPGFCDAKPSVCRKLLAGFDKALTYMRDDIPGTLAILSKRLDKMDPKLVKDAFDGILAGTPRNVSVGEAGFVHAQDYMVNAGIMRPEETLKSFAGIYRNDYAK